nr:type II toxin-antitoxin system PemK/MazF family toxin [uncultured Rhodopila sp.]
MLRGDVVSIADRKGQFTSKPRPAVIVQSDFFAEANTVVVCPISTASVDAPLVRFEIEPSDTLPLQHKSWIEVDMITTVRRSRVGKRIGRIADADLIRLNGALAVFLGLG